MNPVHHLSLEVRTVDEELWWVAVSYCRRCGCGISQGITDGKQARMVKAGFPVL